MALIRPPFGIQTRRNYKPSRQPLRISETEAPDLWRDASLVLALREGAGREPRFTVNRANRPQPEFDADFQWRFGKDGVAITAADGTVAQADAGGSLGIGVDFNAVTIACCVDIRALPSSGTHNFFRFGYINSRTSLAIGTTPFIYQASNKYKFSEAGSMSSPSSGDAATGKHVFLATWVDGGEGNFWVDGVSHDSITGVDMSSHLDDDYRQISLADAQTGTDFDVYWVSVWNRALSEHDAKFLAANPYAMFQRRPTLVSFAGAGGSAYSKALIPAASDALGLTPQLAAGYAVGLGPALAHATGIELSLRAGYSASLAADLAHAIGRSVGLTAGYATPLPAAVAEAVGVEIGLVAGGAYTAALVPGAADALARALDLVAGYAAAATPGQADADTLAIAGRFGQRWILTPSLAQAAGIDLDFFTGIVMGEIFRTGVRDLSPVHTVADRSSSHAVIDRSTRYATEILQ